MTGWEADGSTSSTRSRSSRGSSGIRSAGGSASAPSGSTPTRASGRAGTVVEEHDETGGGAGGHEELYVVLSGRATFTLGGEKLDAPAGTFVFVSDPAVKRKAIAEEEGTVVLAIGGEPGSRLRDLARGSTYFAAMPAFREERWDDAIALMRGRARGEARPFGDPVQPRVRRVAGGAGRSRRSRTSRQSVRGRREVRRPRAGRLRTSTRSAASRGFPA